MTNEIHNNLAPPFLGSEPREARRRPTTAGTTMQRCGTIMQLKYSRDCLRTGNDKQNHKLRSQKTSRNHFWVQNQGRRGADRPPHSTTMQGREQRSIPQVINPEINYAMGGSNESIPQVINPEKNTSRDSRPQSPTSSRSIVPPEPFLSWNELRSGEELSWFRFSFP